MTSKDLIELVTEHEPALMAKAASFIQTTEKECPEFVPDILQDFKTICEYTNEKVAEKATGVGPWATAVGATVAGGLLSSIATDLYDAAKRGLTKGRSFQRIMEVNPSLKREVDKKQLTLAYNALHKFAPDFMADPLIGGALLKQVAELPQMSHKTVIELIGARKELNDAKGRAFSDMGKLAPHLVPDTAHQSTRVERTSNLDKNIRYSRETSRNIRPGE